MNEPKRQHVVPRVYLKHFAMPKKKEWFIDVCDVKKQPSVFFNTNIQNVCVQKDYYTFHKLPGEQQRFLERYYSQTIENDYTEVYNALVNPSVKKISPNLRFKIISFVIAQHFRTVKFNNTFNEFWAKTLTKGYEMMPANSVEKKIYYDDGRGEESFIDFEDKSLDDVIKEESDKNREQINIQSYFWFKRLTELRIDNIISVVKISSPYKFIASDHPVIIHPPVFDPNMHITMPLDSYHLLTLMPAQGSPVLDTKSISRIFLEGNAARLRMLTNNLVQIEQCVQHIVGRKDALEVAINDSKEITSQQLESELSDYLQMLQAKIK